MNGAKEFGFGGNLRRAARDQLGPWVVALVLGLFVCTHCLFAEDLRSITGSVSDLSMRPIKGAKVQAVDCSAKTVTDSSGRFVIKLPLESQRDRRKGNCLSTRAVPVRGMLEVSKPGFKLRRVPVYDPSENLDITLYGVSEKVPVIYSTDLYHPHHDPDDHFDLATIYALEELDIKEIILDNAHGGQDDNPGTVPVRQMNHITGRSLPTAKGLGRALESPTDKALDQRARWQQGVRSMIKTLRESSKKVTIITVGSVRDVAAAYNRSPDLLRRKVDRLLIFIGNATTEPPPPDEMFRGMEWNVHLDPLAYTRIMNSDLPVYWAPCFGQDGYTTIWRAPRRELLQYAADPVVNFFLYMWDKNRQAAPVDYLSHQVERSAPEGDRWMWCCAVFAWVGDRRFVRVPQESENGYKAVQYDSAEDEEVLEPFGFEAFRVTTEIVQHEDGPIVRTRFKGKTEASNRIMVFKKNMPSRKAESAYASIMTSATAHLIGSLGGSN